MISFYIIIFKISNKILFQQIAGIHVSRFFQGVHG